MNTFKTTACLLSLMTAGCAIEDRTPPQTPVRLGNTFSEVVTPVHDVAALTMGTPQYGQPQQLFLNSPQAAQNGGQQVMFVTPQDHTVQNQVPNAPGRGRRVVVGTPGSELDYLASTINSAASPSIQRRSHFGDMTILDSNGRAILTMKTNRKGQSSRVTQQCGSPTGIEEALSFFDRLETSGRTPFAPTFTERKIVGSEGWYDPARLDHNNSYVSEQEESVDEVTERNISGVADVHNESFGSFVIHRGALLETSFGSDNSSFVLHGANPLADNLADSDDEDDTASVISYAGSEGDNFLDLGDEEIDFSHED